MCDKDEGFNYTSWIIQTLFQSLQYFRENTGLNYGHNQWQVNAVTRSENWPYFLACAKNQGKTQNNKLKQCLLEL